MQYTNSEIEKRIAETIHSERDRRLMRRRLIDGRTYDELSAEFYLSRRQVARIIAKAKHILTTEHPPDIRHQKGTPATLRGRPFLFYNGDEKRRRVICTIWQEIRCIIRRLLRIWECSGLISRSR